MGKRGFTLLLCFVLSGCTRVIDTAQPVPAPPVAPITAGQVSDLLSEKVERQDENNLFVTVAPDECAGLAQEVDPPFIFDVTPAAHDGGGWLTDDGRFGVEEMVAVYRADYDSAAAVAKVKRTIESCEDDRLMVTAMEGQELDFRVLPQQDSGAAQIVVWSLVDIGGWACDNAFIAAHNAAIEMTACSEVNGYDALSFAKEALKRIEKLAKTTA